MKQVFTPEQEERIEEIVAKAIAEERAKHDPKKIAEEVRRKLAKEMWR